MKKHFSPDPLFYFMDHSRPHPAFKVWLETDEGYVFGPGVYSLLKKVIETGTLKDAASGLGMSYRYAWGLVKKAEEKLGEPLIAAHKGGKSGGGGAALTKRGEQFLVEFQRIRDQMAQASESFEKASLSGTVKDVRVRGVDYELLLNIHDGDKLTLKKGDVVNIEKTK